MCQNKTLASDLQIWGRGLGKGHDRGPGRDQGLVCQSMPWVPKDAQGIDTLEISLWPLSLILRPRMPLPPLACTSFGILVARSVSAVVAGAGKATEADARQSGRPEPRPVRARSLLFLCSINIVNVEPSILGQQSGRNFRKWWHKKGRMYTGA